MPIYEYQCQACGELTEALQKLSDAPLTRCPACGEDALRKKVSAAAFRLKGGGWYETDFKTGSKKNLAGESDGKADGKADGKKEGKADAKTESKKDAGSSGKAASDKSKGGNSSSAA